MDIFLTLVAEIAKKLGIAAEHLWPQMVQITYYQSLWWLAFWAVALPVASGAVVYAIRWANVRARQKGEVDRYPTTPDECWLVWICAPMLWVFVLIAAIAGMPYHIAGVVSPEARTVLDLVNQFKGR